MRITVGVLAHVDAGKTSLTESILYRTGAIRKLGRVDHADSFMDAHPMEKKRGITVFSDQAMFSLGDKRVFWVDTPGHVDFAPEMERVLPVLDYAVLIIDCKAGVQGHTETVWKLLKKHGIPVFIFINKTDQPDAEPEKCLRELRKLLSEDIVSFAGFSGAALTEELRETAAERDEELLEALTEERYDEALWRRTLTREVKSRAVFPAFFGSALTGDGVDGFLYALRELTETHYDHETGRPFRARVYKVRHTNAGLRQTYMKLLQGTLRAKDTVQTVSGEIKINETALCHGTKLTAVSEAYAGDLVCVSGPCPAKAGDIIGQSPEAGGDGEQAMLSVSVSAEEKISRTELTADLRLLEEEEPSLRLGFQEDGTPVLSVTGELQTEMLAALAEERFGIRLVFGEPEILFRETIKNSVIGIGHYEPLKHYAEVWLRLIPGEEGSGIRFKSSCHVDTLALNWQRLIETHVFEKTHRGVLTGAPLTDVTAELLTGRAHLKHTEGGDFRESTYRAIRNALMQAENVLLEPVCAFALRFPEELYGRVTADLLAMRAEIETTQNVSGDIRITGFCPFRLFRNYPRDFRQTSRGRGVLEFRMDHYAPVEDPAPLIEAAAYNPLAHDTPDSVFCDHGAGHIVPWNEVRQAAHCEWEE